MGLETGTYINDFVSANPTADDGVDRGDDHLRLIKTILRNTFGGFTGQIMVRGTEAQGTTVNDFVVTVTADTTATALQNGMVVFSKATHTNTGAVTLGINSVTATALVDIDGDALVGGELVSGRVFGAIYDSGSSTWVLLTPNDRTSRNGDTITGTLAIIGALALTGDFTATGAATIGGSTSVGGNLAVTGSAMGTTPTAGDNSTKFATTAFVVGLGMSAVLPGQTNKGGLAIYTDGTTAQWGVSSVESLTLQRMGAW